MTLSRSTVSALLGWAAARLEQAGVEQPGLEAQLLLGHSAGWGRAFLIAHPDAVVDEAAQTAFERLVEARAERVPLAYLTGTREFFGRCFQVGPAVLIPRPETELLVEAALAALSRYPPAARPRVLDVGTGSGAVAVTLALEAPRARVFASDLSLAALRVAAANAARLGARVRCFQADLLAALRVPVDVLVANLPYVSAEELAAAAPEVRDHEPRLALLGGARGTEVVERLLAQLGEVLAPGGVALLEIGWQQAEPLRQAARARKLAAEVLRDAAGLERVLRLTHG